MFAYVVAAVGVVLVVLGVAGTALPKILRDIVQSSQTPRVLYGAVAARIVLGAVFLVASATCSRPLAIGTIGVVLIGAGFAGLFLGIQRLQSLIAWWFGFPDSVLRAGTMFTAIFGAFVVYAAVL